MSLMDTYLAGHIGLNSGECVLLKDFQPDPNYHIPDDDKTQQFDMKKADHNSSVGIFRHEDESFYPQFGQTAILYPGRYRVRASLWSYGWDKGQVLPARGTEAARLSAIQLRENGRGANDGSRTLGYYDAPSLAPRVHDFETWLNYKEILALNVASLAPITNYNRKDRAMGFTGPGIANDWVEIEGPLNDIWPPESHRRLFGELPLAEFKPKEHPETHPPLRTVLKQEIIAARNRPDKVSGVWTVQSTEPLADARRLLASFLPRAFRHP